MKAKDLVERKIKLENDLNGVLTDYLSGTMGSVVVEKLIFYHSCTAEVSKFEGLLVELDPSFSDEVPENNNLELDDLVRLSRQANENMVRLVYNFQRETGIKVENIKLRTYPVHKFKVNLRFPRRSESKYGSNFLMNLLKIV